MLYLHLSIVATETAKILDWEFIYDNSKAYNLLLKKS